MTQVQIHPILTDAFNRIEDQGGNQVISIDGSRVFIGYYGTRASISGELFQNVNGKLQSIGVLQKSAPFTNVESAGGAADFSTIIVATSNPSATLGGQIQVLNGDLSVRGVITLPDYITASLSLIVGNFTQDYRFFSVTYGVSTNTTTLLSNLDVYDACNLKLVARTQIPGYANNSQIFIIGNRLYVALGLSLLLPSDFATLIAPFALNIYRVKKTIHLIASVPQNQFTRATAVSVISPDEVLIAVTNRLSLNVGQPSVLTGDLVFPNATPGDSRNVRVYSFDGCDLDLIAAKYTGTNPNGISWLPGSNILLETNRVAGGEVQGVAHLYQVVNGEFVNIDDFVVTPPFAFSGVISANGKWMLINGADADAGVNAGSNSINFYRLKTRKAC